MDSALYEIMRLGIGVIIIILSSSSSQDCVYILFFIKVGKE